MADVKVSVSITNKPPKTESIIGKRHYQYVLMFFTVLIPFGMRTALSVGIISMTSDSPPRENIPTYPEWDNTDVVLSSFFWGIIISQILGGKIPQYFGPKWVLTTSVLIGSIANIIIPPMAAWLGSTGVIICRIIQGLTQGFIYPSTHFLLSKWVPVFERSRVANFVYGGGNLGIAASMPVTGAICASNLGWPTAFYIYGSVGVAWSIIFAIFAKNSPLEHDGMSTEERAYILSGNAVDANVKSGNIKTPWFSIATSIPLWAILACDIAHCWGGFTLLTEIPTFMENIMDFDINSNSQLSSLPYFTQFLLGLTVSPIADKLMEKKILTVTATRKVFTSLSCFFPAAALTALAFVGGSHKVLVTVLLVITVGSTALSNSGHMVNILDVTPNHAGTVVALANGIGNIFSIVGPITVGLLGDDKKDPILWRKVFLISAAIFVVCGIIYDFFASGEVQPWNEIQEDEKKKEDGIQKDKS